MTETTAANPELLAHQVSSLLMQPLEAASVVLSSGPVSSIRPASAYPEVGQRLHSHVCG